MNNESLIALETKIAYQEDYIQEINQSLFAMQKQIDHLELTCQTLKDKLNDIQNYMPNDMTNDETPPHY